MPPGILTSSALSDAFAVWQLYHQGLSVRRRLGRKVVRLYMLDEVLQLSVAGWLREIYFQHPDGTWEANKPRGQGVISGAIPLKRFRRSIDDATQRPAELHGRVEKRRGALGSKPVFAGTRVPVSAVQEYLRRGYDPIDILKEYPSLTAEDVETARERLAG